MDQTVDERAPEQAGLQRRTLLKGAAWSVPAVLLVGATPALAASNTLFAFTSLVAVPALATPALINATNSGASVKVSGEGPDNASISVSVGSYSANPAPQVTDGKWDHTIPASSLPEGLNVQVTAALGTNSATKTYTKDTVPPVPTISATPGKTSNVYWVDLSVGLDSNNNPAGNGQAVVTYALETAPNTPLDTATITTSQTVRFSGLVNKSWYIGTVTQTDGARNTGTVSTSRFQA